MMVRAIFVTKTDLVSNGLLTVLRSGVWVPLLVMLPNLVWMALPKKPAGKRNPVPLWLTIVENVGRVAVLTIPFFYVLDFNKPLSSLVSLCMGLALSVYYTAWIRFFLGGRLPELMRTSLLGVPLPLAVTPVIFFLCSSYLLGSWLMFASSLLFGCAHVWISRQTL